MVSEICVVPWIFVFLQSVLSEIILQTYLVFYLISAAEHDLVENPEDNFLSTGPFDLYIRKLENINIV